MQGDKVCHENVGTRRERNYASPSFQSNPIAAVVVPKNEFDGREIRLVKRLFLQSGHGIRPLSARA